MGALQVIRSFFRTPAVTQHVIAHERTRPGQALDQAQYMYAPGHVSPRTLAQYALNAWVYTAVSRLAEMAMVSPLHVVSRSDPSQQHDNHPLLSLLGVDGRPNDAQDSLEFWENHFTHFDLSGNVYWYWHSPTGGAPTEVFILDPTQMYVIPGRDRIVSHYEYHHAGAIYRLDPVQVTHYKRANPYSIYYGLSAIDALMREVDSDRSMQRWNAEFFSSGAPSGILIVDDSVSREDMKRVEADMNALHSERRRVAVVRAKPGAAVWVDAAMRHHDLDFADGRLLSRQIVYDALGLHVGLLSEASTEAHARVAERRVLHSVWVRHQRTASALNNVLGFWPGAARYRVRFEDARVADWQQEAMKLTALRPYLTVNEVRARHLELPPVPWGEREAGGNDTMVEDGPTADRGDSRAVRPHAG